MIPLPKFNVDDGLEDCRMSMEQFGAEHFLGGTVIAMTVEEPERKAPSDADF